VENAHKIGLGLFALAMGAAVLAMQPQPAAEDAEVKAAAARHLTLAKVAPSERRDIDYRAFDQRLGQLISEPGMVGLAVGIVENGRITFLKGYGETEAGSGEPVTPETVFRWASVSKGVASTMVAKLAE
jgi:beta-lactamase class C